MRNSLPIVVVAVALACPASALAQTPTSTLDQLSLIAGGGEPVSVWDRLVRPGAGDSSIKTLIQDELMHTER